MTGDRHRRPRGRPRRLAATVEALRDEGYDYFDWFTAVDQTDAPEPGFDLVCHLLSVGEPRSLRSVLLRTRLPEGAPAPP